MIFIGINNNGIIIIIMIVIINSNISIIIINNIIVIISLVINTHVKILKCLFASIFIARRRSGGASRWCIGCSGCKGCCPKNALFNAL